MSQQSSFPQGGAQNLQPMERFRELILSHDFNEAIA
jgi:hypothetical protein